MLSAIAIDARSLAATRITLAVLVLVELFDRWPLVDVFYSDASPYPITNIHSPLHRLACAHAWSGASAYVKALFVVHAAAAGALALGYRTRIAALATWYLYWSLTLRNCSVAYITDRYLHFFLLLLAFLPCARVWSAEARAAGDALPPPTASLATALARLQLVWIYIDAGGGKLLDPDGAWALGAPVPALEPMLLHTRIGRTVRTILGPLVRPFSASVAWVELLVPLIALLAAARGAPRVQAACAATMVGLHAGIGLCVNNAAILSTVASAVWLLYCPAEIWDAIGATLAPPPKAPPSPPRGGRDRRVGGARRLRGGGRGVPAAARSRADVRRRRGERRRRAALVKPAQQPVERLHLARDPCHVVHGAGAPRRRIRRRPVGARRAGELGRARRRRARRPLEVVPGARRDGRRRRAAVGAPLPRVE